MKLWYRQPASQWCEALPTGNGRLGGMVFGKVKEEMIQLNEDSVWSGKPLNRINPDAAKYLDEVRRLLREGKPEEAERLAMYALSGTPNSERSYQTAGELYLNFHGQEQEEGYQRALDLETGVVSVDYMAGGVKYHREVISSWPAQILAVRLECDQAEGLSFDCHLGRCHNWTDEVCTEGEDTVWFTAGNETDGGIGFCVMARIVPEGGTVRKIGEHLIVEQASSAVIYLAVETSFRHPGAYVEAARKQIARAAETSWQELRTEHIRDYQELAGRVCLSLEGMEAMEEIPTDIRLQRVKDGKEDSGIAALYYQYGRYLLIASSREGSLPANLQGIWNDSLTPAWESKYTININAQMNYWAAESGALSECHLPFFELLERVCENGKKTAREMYGCRGSMAHHNTDLYADTAPQDHCITSTFWPMGEAWMATHIWEHYSYTMDREFLERYFPVLEENVLFFRDFLIEGPDGTRITSPSISPENTYILPDGTQGHLCEGPMMDVEILYELFDGYLKACRVLGKEGEEVCAAKKLMESFPKLKIGKYGQLQEWMEDYEEAEPGHRHISHLYGMYPGTMINPEQTPELMKAARVTLERRLANGGGHTGWSRAWIIGLWARFGEGEKAYENFRALLTGSTFPNLMDNHPMGDGAIFQIDGNFGAAAALAEMLVQSQTDTVYLLPALPKQMKTGSVRGLRLRGKSELDMEWKDSKVTRVRIVSGYDRKMKLRVNGAEKEIELKAGTAYEETF